MHLKGIVAAMVAIAALAPSGGMAHEEHHHPGGYGTAPVALQEHAAAMRNHADMHHESANMVHVAPGSTEDIVWKFTRAGEFGFGCLVPGHLEAGMVARCPYCADPSGG
jgi:uncharacterized cupredoxin-like copper-binding protein